MAVRKTKAAALWMSAGRLAEHSPVAGRERRSKPPKTRRESFGVLIFKSIDRGRRLLLGDLAVELSEGAPDLVGAWSWFHKEIYGIEPVELYSEWPAANAAAKRVLVEYLGGDIGEALDFLAWYANRARKSNGDSRMRWKFVFNANAVTDWKVSKRRTG